LKSGKLGNPESDRFLGLPNLGLSRIPALRRKRKSNGYIGSPRLAVQEKFAGFTGRDGEVSKELKAEFSENDGGPSGLGKMGTMGEIRRHKPWAIHCLHCILAHGTAILAKACKESLAAQLAKKWRVIPLSERNP
jgi:hypothetical protein